MKRALILVLACACGAEDTPRLDAVAPPYAPLSGGTVVRLTGANFPADARVLVGGREAAVVIALNDATLDVIVPPGDHPGDAEVIVVGAAGNAIVPGLFRYSAPPVIAEITPRELVAVPEGGTIVITGSGFLDDDAGTPNILLDGLPVPDVRTLTDTEIRLAVPNMRPLLEPTLTLVNTRGTAVRERAYRYRPSVHGGLLLFTRGALLAFYVDPVRGEVVPIPRATLTDQVAFTSIVVDDHGDYWGIDRTSQGGIVFGRLDMRTHALEQPILVGERIPALVRVGTDHFAIARDALAIGRLNIANGDFSAEVAVPCCGGYGLSHHDGKLWFTHFQDFSTPTLRSLDLSTGQLSDPIALFNLPGSARIEDIRHYQGVLYAICRDGSLRSIDMVTGETTLVASNLFQVHAIEVFD